MSLCTPDIAKSQRFDRSRVLQRFFLKKKSFLLHSQSLFNSNTMNLVKQYFTAIYAKLVNSGCIGHQEVISMKMY